MNSPEGDREGSGFESIDQAMHAHGYRSDALLEILHVAQRTFGRLSKPVLAHIARGLKLPPSKVLGVASFYAFFTFESPAEHTCLICMGTACYVAGASAILDAVRSELRVAPREVTPDGQWTLHLAHCLGNCGHAPLVVVDESNRGQAMPSAIVSAIRSVRNS